jgi:hypothetical protein
MLLSRKRLSKSGQRTKAGIEVSCVNDVTDGSTGTNQSENMVGGARIYINLFRGTKINYIYWI